MRARAAPSSGNPSEGKNGKNPDFGQDGNGAI